MGHLLLVHSILLAFGGNQAIRSAESAHGGNSSSHATDHPATSYFPRPSSSATGFQATGSVHKISNHGLLGIVLTPLSSVTFVQETASSLKLTKSSNHIGFQTAANFSVFFERSSPTYGIIDLSSGSLVSAQTSSSPSSARGVQTTSNSIGSVQIPGAVSGFTPGEPSTVGEPLPLLAKILIPVVGVLFVVVVGVAWCCCVRGKERENFENPTESTQMVRLDGTENRGGSC